MAFPSFTRSYLIDGYSYAPQYEVNSYTFHSKNTRRRKTHTDNDVVFNVGLVLSNAEFETFESYVQNDLSFGADDFTGPYFTSDVKYTGTLHIINGEYEAELVSPNYWRVSYQFLLRDRDMTQEEAIYDDIIALGTFANARNVINLLAELVNEDWP